ncbi:ATP-binding protein [Tistrella bauzanensis]|uniref:Glutathione import ATP-binding protein GsiA n=1 Tax=Tistrella bauzanensis TaxID=657419 RepID=A0ABQ1JA76_9PROT|nr:ATP-binding protein [Tistrella bauzanensis]
MTTPVLCVTGLTAAFRVGRDGWKAVVDGVSFDIGRRETLAVVGESGSGKSVTAMSIMRLLSPATCRIGGRVRLDGQDLLTLPEPDMCRIRGRDIAMIFQEPMTSLNPVRSIGFQIGEALMLHRGLGRAAAEAEAARMLDRVRIPAARSRLKDYPASFSGGMRQRVMIAMALACGPRLLIADEPTTALDVTIQAQILELIRDIQDEDGMSVLFITHDLGVVAEIADRTVVMCNGAQIEEGDTTAIFAAPRQPYTRALLAAVPRLGTMADHDRPMPFPVVDRDTGIAAAVPDLPDTVDHDAVPALAVHNLVSRYQVGGGLFGRARGAVHAVENVSFSVQPGETLALVGESGCGKSTIGRTIMRLLAPVSGDILVHGETVLAGGARGGGASDPGALFRQVQMVFQDPFSSLNPRKTVGSAIAAPMQINGIARGAALRARVADLLVQVGLDPAMAGRYPQEFSGGQRQRICIARGLALGPSVMIADEAVSALDVSIKAQVINLMLDLQQHMGLAYLFISHDMAGGCPGHC